MSPPPQKRRVAIVGAGASGLAAARQALLYGYEPVVFERTDRIGGFWHYDDDPNVVLFQSNESRKETFDAVLVCSGFYAQAYRPPELRLQSAFRGRILHSSQYRTPAGYDGKRVVVVGFGNSAISIACELASVASQVYLASQRDAWLMPDLTDGATPWDVAFNSQLYAWARRVMPTFVRNLAWHRESRKICDYESYNIRPAQKFTAAHLTFANTLPYHLAHGRVKVKRRLLSFTESGDGVEFEDNTFAYEINEVIFCTGFTFDFPFIENGKLIRVIYNDFHLYKHMFSPELAPHNNLALIGHLQPTGPLFPVVEMQARFFFHVLAGAASLPPPAKMKAKLERQRCNMSLNYVKTQRYTQIEDYVNYMNDLASFVSCRPRPLLILLSGDPKLALACFFGPTTAHQYRLVGRDSWAPARAQILRQCPPTSLVAGFVNDRIRLILLLVFIYFALYLFRHF